MKKLAIAAGVAAVAVLVIVFFLYSGGNLQEQQSALETEADVGQEVATGAASEAVQDTEAKLAPAAGGTATYNQQSKTRSLLVTQDRTGTECKTPSGRVCTVSPGRINSPCACGSQNGLIIR